MLRDTGYIGVLSRHTHLGWGSYDEDQSRHSVRLDLQHYREGDKQSQFISFQKVHTAWVNTYWSVFSDTNLPWRHSLFVINQFITPKGQSLRESVRYDPVRDIWEAEGAPDGIREGGSAGSRGRESQERGLRGREEDGYWRVRHLASRVIHFSSSCSTLCDSVSRAQIKSIRYIVRL